MGIGMSTGENRAAEAAKKAISSPLLETSIDGAKGVLMNITGGSNLVCLKYRKLLISLLPLQMKMSI